MPRSAVARMPSAEEACANNRLLRISLIFGFDLPISVLIDWFRQPCQDAVKLCIQITHRHTVPICHNDELDRYKEYTGFQEQVV